MASDDGYMLQRDSHESKRLNTQHEFMVSMSNGHLIHPSISCKCLQAVADVATGTGIWLRDVAASPTFSSQSDANKTEFVGFDISPKQFPSAAELSSSINFVTHDMTEPFPLKYHEKFDLVSVRLLSYVIKAVDLEKIVRHILEISRPGGYLQWLDCDAADSWTIPETTMATATVNYLIAEKRARGLLPGIVTPLVKTIQSYSLQIPEDHLNPISSSPDLMRITQLQTISSRNHPSPAVAASRKLEILSVAVVMLEASISRRKAIIADPATSSLQVDKLVKEIESMTEQVKAIKMDEGIASNDWDMEMTLIIARKAVTVNENEPWMSLKYPA